MVLLCLFAAFECFAQCTLACNDQVQVSLDQEGLAIILPDMILDGDETTCPGTKTVHVIEDVSYSRGREYRNAILLTGGY